MWPLLIAVLENARKGKVVWNEGSDILCNVVTVRCEGAYRSRSQNTASDCDTGRSGPLTNLILGIFKDERMLPGMKHEMQWNVEWGVKWSYAWWKILPLSSPPPFFSNPRKLGRTWSLPMHGRYTRRTRLHVSHVRNLSAIENPKEYAE